MNYRTIQINTASPEKPKSKVLIIYTGGTFGMVQDSSGTLIPFDFSMILEHLPALRNLSLELTVISFENPIDSSNMAPEHWIIIGTIIFEHYPLQDGFVILHGTDTMAYTASALSFMLSGLNKPVVFTGAQLPITEPRSDARENLITALEIASSKIDGKTTVPEVCVYFGNELLRGSRTKKVESQHFDAFESGNYPPLAKAGVKINFNTSAIKKADGGDLKLLSRFDNHVAVLKIFPGISPVAVESILNIKNLRGLVLETYGSGNGPTSAWFLNAIRKAVNRGLLIINVSQCPGGMVQQGKYETSRAFKEIGVIGGADLTVESAITKLMLGLGEFESNLEVKNFMVNPVAGELTN